MLHLVAIGLVLAAGAEHAEHGEHDERDDADHVVHVDASSADDGVAIPSAGAETVVRARRATPPSQELIEPSSASTAALSPIGGASGAQLMARAPGVYLSQHAGQGKAPQLFLRGFDAEHGQDVEVTVMGIPINEASNVHGQGYADVSFVPAELVTRLVVNEGTFEPAQGDFGVAGAFHYELGLPHTVVARVSAGSFGLARAFVGVRPPGLSERSFVAAELVRGDGFGPSRAFSRANALSSLEHNIAAGVSAQGFLALSTSSYQSAGVRRVADLDGSDDAFFGSYEAGQGGQSSRALVGLTLRQRDDVGRTIGTVGLTRRQLALRHNFTGTLLFDDGDTVSQGHNADTGFVSLVRDTRFTLFERTQHVVVGASARGDAVSSSQTRLNAQGDVHTIEVDAALQLGHAAVFGELVLTPLPALTLRLGGRAEGVSFDVDDALAEAPQNSTTNDDDDSSGAGSADSADDDIARTRGLFVGPRVQAALRALPWLTLGAAYGEGFRTPQASSLASGETPPLTVARTGQLDVVMATASAQRALRLRACTFVVHVESDRVFDHASATSLFIGPTLRVGAQAIASVTLDDVFAAASVTAVDARLIESGGAVPFAPPLVARLDVGTRQAIAVVDGRDVVVFANVAASAIGARPLPFGDSADAFAVVSGNVGVGIGAISVSVDADNVTDARYADGAFTYASRFAADDSIVPVEHITAAPPRLLQLTLSVALPGT